MYSLFIYWQSILRRFFSSPYLPSEHILCMCQLIPDLIINIQLQPQPAMNFQMQICTHCGAIPQLCYYTMGGTLVNHIILERPGHTMSSPEYMPHIPLCSKHTASGSESGLIVPSAFLFFFLCCKKRSNLRWFQAKTICRWHLIDSSTLVRMNDVKMISKCYLCLH